MFAKACNEFQGHNTSEWWNSAVLSRRNLLLFRAFRKYAPEVVRVQTTIRLAEQIVEIPCRSSDACNFRVTEKANKTRMCLDMNRYPSLSLL